jgi:hypothetical protein
MALTAATVFLATIVIAGLGQEKRGADFRDPAR